MNVRRNAPVQQLRSARTLFAVGFAQVAAVAALQRPGSSGISRARQFFDNRIQVVDNAAFAELWVLQSVPLVDFFANDAWVLLVARAFPQDGCQHACVRLAVLYRVHRQKAAGI